jgi:predicted DNA-binding protein
MKKTAENITNNQKIQTSLQLTIGQVEALKEIAYQQKRSMSGIAREVIAKYIEEQHAEMGRPSGVKG